MQLEILRASDGDVDALSGFKAEIVERDLDLRMCRDGLCFTMPDECKARIKGILSGG